MMSFDRPDIHHDILRSEHRLAAAPDHRSIAHDGIVLRHENAPLQDASGETNIAVAKVLQHGFLNIELRYADYVGNLLHSHCDVPAEDDVAYPTSIEAFPRLICKSIVARSTPYEPCFGCSCRSSRVAALEPYARQKTLGAA